MTIVLTATVAVILFGVVFWLRFGLGRGVVTALYWLANRLMALAHAADSFRLVYHQRLQEDVQGPTPEAVIHSRLET